MIQSHSLHKRCYVQFIFKYYFKARTSLYLIGLERRVDDQHNNWVVEFKYYFVV